MQIIVIKNYNKITFFFMIGTATEMLLYLSYSARDFRKVCSTNETIVRIRSKLGLDKYAEKQMAEWLRTLGCVQIRPSVTIPAIIVSRQKRIFDELTFVRLYLNEEMQKDLERKLEMSSVFYAGYLNERALKIFLKKKKAYIEQPRITLPSVWSYEPSYDTSVSPRVADTIGRIIGNQIPFR
jgi:hypothetical protein